MPFHVAAIGEINPEVKLDAELRSRIRLVHGGYPASCKLEYPYSINSIELPSGSAIQAWRELSMPREMSETCTPLSFSILQNSSSPVTSRQKCLYRVPIFSSCTFPPHISTA